MKDYRAIWLDQENYPDFTPYLDELINELADTQKKLEEVTEIKLRAQKAAQAEFKKYEDMLEIADSKLRDTQKKLEERDKQFASLRDGYVVQVNKGTDFENKLAIASEALKKYTKDSNIEYIWARGNAYECLAINHALEALAQLTGNTKTEET